MVMLDHLKTTKNRDTQNKSFIMFYYSVFHSYLYVLNFIHIICIYCMDIKYIFIVNSSNIIKIMLKNKEFYFRNY